MKENSVWLHGQVYGNPKVIINAEKMPVKARIVLRVVRRLRSLNGMAEADIRFDYPIIITEDPEIIRYCEQNVREGDMLDVKGVFTTRKRRKKRICPCCGKENIMLGVENCITPVYVSVREKGLSEIDGFSLLKERNEVSNNLYAIGTVVSDVEYYEDEKQRYSQYCIMLGRKYWIKTDPADLRVDFPHVKSYGILGIRDKEYLESGAHVFIAGSVSTRNYKRHTYCEHCREEFEFDDSTMEIHSYSVEYLDEKVTDDTEDPEFTEM